MDISRPQPTAKGPAEWFTGDVFMDVVVRNPEPSAVRMNLVRFTPCARTAWHSHLRGQQLVVVDGVGLVQARGGAVQVLRPGDVVWTPPGEEHWHGAAPDHAMAHYALWEGDETAWGDLVTDEEYGYPVGD